MSVQWVTDYRVKTAEKWRRVKRWRNFCTYSSTLLGPNIWSRQWRIQFSLYLLVCQFCDTALSGHFLCSHCAPMTALPDIEMTILWSRLYIRRRSTILWSGAHLIVDFENKDTRTKTSKLSWGAGALNRNRSFFFCISVSKVTMWAGCWQRKVLEGYKAALCTCWLE